MGRKIFVSYKYADGNVKKLNNNRNTTVRDYVTEFERKLDLTDHIYKGESDGEDLSNLSDDTIWEKLKDRIYDSSITIVFISPNMKESDKKDRDQWIPWEVSYSLKEMSRKNSNGVAITSKSNAMIAVVLPDKNGMYSYYLENKECCPSGCNLHKTNILFEIIRKNKFNANNIKPRICNNGSHIWNGESSYIAAVRWDDFIHNYNKYIDAAYQRQKNIANFNITKDVD